MALRPRLKRLAFRARASSIGTALSSLKVGGTGLLAAIVALSSVSCAPADAIHVRIFYDAPADAPLLTAISVIVGGSKSSWGSVQPGDSVGVFLSPEGDPLPDISMHYTQRRLPYSWYGPKFSAGVAYGVSIHIAADGTVKEHHRKWRCSLD
jgi:hypothetical protein